MKISYNKSGGGSILYDHNDWLAGMNTTSAGSDFGLTGGNPLMSEIDPLRKYGYATLGFNAVDVTNISSVTATIVNGIVKGDNAYLIGGALVHKLSSLSTGTISTTAPFPHTIVHGAHTNPITYDITNYYDYNGSATTNKLSAFYSFSDDTDWDVGVYDYVGNAFDDSFMSTKPTTPLAAPYLTGGVGFPHPLVNGDDDILYIGDRNFVHAYDRSTGAFSAAVLTLPAGWIITSFCTNENYQLCIGSYYTTGQGTGNTFNRGRAKVWFWSYLALDPDYSRDLRDNYVSELIQWSGTIAAFTSGRKTLSDAGKFKLQALNGSQFEVVKTWTNNGLPVRGGVDNVGNDLYWNAAGGIYAYTKRPDTGKYILNELIEQGVVGGMLRFFTATSTYHTSFGAGAGNGLRYFSNNYNDAGTLEAEVASPDFAIGEKGELTAVTVKFGNTFTGGRAFRLDTNLDYVGGVLIDDMTTLTTTRTLQRLTRTDGTALGTFNTLQPELIWSSGSGATDAAQVEYIKYEFKTKNVDQGETGT